MDAKIVGQIIKGLGYLFHFSMLILLVAKRNTTFKGPFYNIMRIVFVADLASCFCTNIMQKAYQISFLSYLSQNSEYFPSLMLNFSIYNYVTEFLGHLLMAFNRFTLIWFPLKQQKIWNYQWYIFVLLFLPFVNVAWKLHEPGMFVLQADGNVLTTLKNSYAVSLTSTILAVIYSVTTSLSAIFNGLALIKFYLHKQTTASVNVNEKSLLFVSLIVFIAQAMRTSYTILRLIFPADPTMTVILVNALPILNDIFALSGSISLLILSPTTRKEYSIFYFCDPKTKITIATKNCGVTNYNTTTTTAINSRKW